MYLEYIIVKQVVISSKLARVDIFGKNISTLKNIH